MTPQTSTTDLIAQDKAAWNNQKKNVALGFLVIAIVVICLSALATRPNASSRNDIKSTIVRTPNKPSISPTSSPHLLNTNEQSRSFYVQTHQLIHIIKLIRKLKSENTSEQVILKEIFSRFQQTPTPDAEFNGIGSDFCNKTSNANDSLRITLAVQSNVYQFDRRALIRQTWGRNNRLLNKIRIQIVFAIGQCSEIDTLNCSQRLQSEQSRHQDLIVANFRNETEQGGTKLRTILNWYYHQCRVSSDYLILVQDTNYISIVNLVMFLTQTDVGRKKFDPIFENQHMKYFRPRMSWFYGGHLLPNIPISREPGNPFYIPRKEFPLSFVWNLISRQFVVMSNFLASDLYEASKYIRELRLEDVYAAVMCDDMDVEATSIPNVFNDSLRHLELASTVSVMMSRTQVMKRLWKVEFKKGNA
jgi:hypothetical protein